MILTTTPTVERRAAGACLGIVTDEAIGGANIIRDLFAGIRDIVVGRSAAYGHEHGKTRKTALREMEVAPGADAVVGADRNNEVISNVLMVSASGTAVRLD